MDKCRQIVCETRAVLFSYKAPFSRTNGFYYVLRCLMRLLWRFNFWNIRSTCISNMHVLSPYPHWYPRELEPIWNVIKKVKRPNQMEPRDTPPQRLNSLRNLVVGPLDSINCCSASRIRVFWIDSFILCSLCAISLAHSDNMPTSDR
jgi:hypothetical protein